MTQFLLTIIALSLVASPMPAHASMDVELADCEALNALTLEKKQSFFSMTHFMQTPGALSLVIGPHCSYLGEIQAIAIINDPKLTIEPTKEILYFIPSINTLFVPHHSNDAIAYAIKITNNKEPLEYFIQNKQKMTSLAEVAKDFALYAKDIRNPSSSASSKSSTSTSIVIQQPVQRPLTPKASSSTIMMPAAPIFSSSSSQGSSVTKYTDDTTKILPTELPQITETSDQPIFSRSESVSIWQVIIGIGIVLLLIYIYSRKRTRDLISQG